MDLINPPTPGNLAQRIPKFALTLSLMMPGLGQIYNGEVAKGISCFLLFAFAIPAFCWVGIQLSTSLGIFVIAGVITALGLYAYCIVNAYLSARKIGKNYQPNQFNKVYVYVAMMLFGYFFILFQLSEYTTAHLTQLFTVPSHSMVPNILQGDFIFADKRVNSWEHKRKLARGDIGVFIFPNDRTSLYIKRIIGFPQDKIEITGHEVRVNGQLISGEQIHDLGSGELNLLLKNHDAFLERGPEGRSYPVIWKKESPIPSETQTWIVPNGHVFVLGDHRSEALDSRQFGYIPLSDVIGITKQILFSYSGDAGLRLNRTGKVIEGHSK